MRVMVKVSIPTEAGNKGIETGSLPQTMMGQIERWKPEATYFTAMNGRRTGLFFLDLKEPSDIPSMAEPFFLLGAEVDVSPCMNPDDLRAGLEKLQKK